MPVVLTEFGGIASRGDPASTWGYSRGDSAEELAARYSELLDAVRSLALLAGFCYTQFADTYQEANGLLYADRTPEVPARADRGRDPGATLVRASADAVLTRGAASRDALPEQRTMQRHVQAALDQA